MPSATTTTKPLASAVRSLNALLTMRGDAVWQGRPHTLSTSASCACLRRAASPAPSGVLVISPSTPPAAPPSSSPLRPSRLLPRLSPSGSPRAALSSPPKGPPAVKGDPNPSPAARPGLFRPCAGGVAAARCGGRLGPPSARRRGVRPPVGRHRHGDAPGVRDRRPGRRHGPLHNAAPALPSGAVEAQVGTGCEHAQAGGVTCTRRRGGKQRSRAARARSAAARAPAGWRSSAASPPAARSGRPSARTPATAEPTRWARPQLP